MDGLAGFEGRTAPARPSGDGTVLSTFPTKGRFCAPPRSGKTAEQRTATARPHPFAFRTKSGSSPWLPKTIIKRQERSDHQRQAHGLIRRGDGCPEIATRFSA